MVGRTPLSRVVSASMGPRCWPTTAGAGPTGPVSVPVPMPAPVPAPGPVPVPGCSSSRRTLGRTWVVVPTSSLRSAVTVVRPDIRTAWRSWLVAAVVPPGSVRPLHTTGARRLPPAGSRTTGMRAVSAMALPLAAGAASCTRKLA